MRRPRTRTLVLLAALAVLLGALGTVGTVGYLTFVRGPVNPPSEACDGGRPDDAPPTVVAAGASMVQGTLGADWVGSLRDEPEHEGYEFVNAGSNGDTSADLLDRVDTDIVACDPEAVLVLVGANDVRGDTTPSEYRATMAEVVDRIQEGTDARVALFSLPPIGEDPDTEINGELAEYNAAIRDVAEEAEVDHLPAYERIADHLDGLDGDLPAYDFSFYAAFRAGFEHHVLRRGWDEVADAHGMTVFVDHLHLSDRGGAMVADLAGTWLADPSPRR